LLEKRSPSVDFVGTGKAVGAESVFNRKERGMTGSREDGKRRGIRSFPASRLPDFP
jgi:hypothetical protein